MDSARFRVGIIGLQPGRSWGAVAHLPALHALPNDFVLSGIANTNMCSSEAAAREYGIEHAYRSPSELIAAADIDIVAVTVKVQHHLKIVADSIEAGKAVYCEWPLCSSLSEARTLVRMMEGFRTKAGCVIGLQALVAPEILFAKALIEQGLIGDVLSTSIVGNGGNWGALIDQANAYTLDPANGATLLSIPVGHVLAALEATLGNVAQVSAMLVNRRRTVHIKESGVEVPMLTPDQVLLNATLANGIPLALHYRGGVSHGTGFRWGIHGTRGELRLTAKGGHAQFMQLTLAAACDAESEFRVLDIPQKYSICDPEVKELPPRARNVARIYGLLAQDLRNHTRTAPSTDTALANHRLLEAIERSAESGRRIRPEDC